MCTNGPVSRVGRCREGRDLAGPVRPHGGTAALQGAAELGGDQVRIAQRPGADRNYYWSPATMVAIEAVNASIAWVRYCVCWRCCVAVSSETLGQLWPVLDRSGHLPEGGG